MRAIKLPQILLFLGFVLLGGVAIAYSPATRGEAGTYMVAASSNSEVSAVINTTTGEIWYLRTGSIRKWGSKLST